MTLTRLAATAALSAALALSVALTAAASPALAATPGVSPAPRPDLIRTSTIDVVPISSGPSFQPDVRVNYLGKTSGSGGKVTYRFRVENIGIGTAFNVGLGNTIGQRASSGSVSTRQSGSSGTIASLATDQSTQISVTCNPLPGYVCDGASLEAYLQNDLNPSNNKAGS